MQHVIQHAAYLAAAHEHRIKHPAFPARQLPGALLRAHACTRVNTAFLVWNGRRSLRLCRHYGNSFATVPDGGKVPLALEKHT